MNFSEEMKKHRDEIACGYQETVKAMIKNKIGKDPYADSWVISVMKNAHSNIYNYLVDEGFLVTDVGPTSSIPTNETSLRIVFKK